MISKLLDSYLVVGNFSKRDAREQLFLLHYDNNQRHGEIYNLG